MIYLLLYSFYYVQSCNSGNFKWKIIMRVLWLLIVFLSCCMLFITSAYAAVTTVQAISFGSWIVKKNDAQYDIVLNPDGTYTYDAAAYIEISPPRGGIYDIDGLPVSTAIASVTVTQVSPLAGGSGKTFQMLTFQETHPSSTDASGVARINIGATSRSSGDSTAYPDETYSGNINIQVNF